MHQEDIKSAVCKQMTGLERTEEIRLQGNGNMSSAGSPNPRLKPTAVVARSKLCCWSSRAALERAAGSIADAAATASSVSICGWREPADNGLSSSLPRQN